MSSIDSPVIERTQFEEYPLGGQLTENVALDSGYNITDAADAGRPSGKEIPDSAPADPSSALAEADPVDSLDRDAKEQPTPEPHVVIPEDESTEENKQPEPKVSAAAYIALQSTVEEPVVASGVPPADGEQPVNSPEGPPVGDDPAEPVREASGSGRGGDNPAETTFDEDDPDDDDQSGSEADGPGHGDQPHVPIPKDATEVAPEDEQEPRPKGYIPTPYPEDFEEQKAIAEEATSRLRELATPEALAANGVVEADQFVERLQYEVTDLRRGLIGTENYQRTSGDYSELKYAMLPEGQTRSPEDRDHEAYLSDQIRQRLDAIDPSDPQPVIALDIGGGRGTTWSRIALEHADDIRAGRLALVVTNLASSPDSYQTPEHWPPDADPAEYQRLLAAAQEGLVHFVNSTFVGLPYVTIPLPNGNRVGLRDRVAITHEVRSLTLWTHVSEVTVMEATKVIAPGGMYLVGGTDVRAQRGFALNPAAYDRVNGIRNTHEALQVSRGLRLTKMPDDGAYGWHLFQDTRAA